MNYRLKSVVPCAYITKQKQRVKQFGENVYLKDGSEFEVELYNPSKKTVLSKIKINGEFINGGGIILRPGERVYLERYLDTANKFKFETYSVDNSTETKNAIVNNGDVEVLFYDEQHEIESRLGDIWYGTSTSTGNLSNNIYGTTTTKVNYSSDVIGLNGDLGNNINQNMSHNIYLNNVTSKSIETGRVEKGSESNQTFNLVNKNFNIWTVSTSVWKILPESQKPVELGDLVDRCSNCSTKIKKSSWKFCPECGKEVKRTKTEIHYTLDTKVSVNGKHYLMSAYNDTLDNFLKRNESKLIYIKSDSLTENSLRAIVID